MNFSFILISDYLNKSVYILANKPYKCLKKMFYELNNYKLYMKKKYSNTYTCLYSS